MRNVSRTALSHKTFHFQKNKIKKKKITLFLLAQLELVAVDSERIAICKEFQPAQLKIAFSQFLGGNRLSGSMVKAGWRTAVLTRTVSVQDNAPWELHGHVPPRNHC